MSLLPWNSIIKQLEGKADSQDVILLNNWLDADQRHHSLWSEIQAVWEQSQAIGSEFNPDSEQAWSEVLKKIKTTPDKRRSIISFRFWGKIAVACILIFCCMGIGYWQGSKSFTTTPVTFESQTGKSKLTLADGTTVLLNQHSELIVPDRFAKNERSVELKGEAFFDVTHDEQVPFYVHSNKMTIRVHGTKFNVKSVNRENCTEVSLFEGSVSVSTENNNDVFLKPGEIAVLDNVTGKLNVLKTDLYLESVWMKDTLSFEEMHIASLVKILERRYDTKIVVDPQLKDSSIYYTMTLSDEPLDKVLKIMQKVNVFKYKSTKDSIMIY